MTDMNNQKAIGLIVKAIKKSPQTLINISQTGPYHQIFGPRIYGEWKDEPRFGFGDKFINPEDKAVYEDLIDSKFLMYCGSFVKYPPKQQGSIDSLAIMILLARAGIINHLDIFTRLPIDTWAAVYSPNKTINELLGEIGKTPDDIRENIAAALTPDSKFSAGRELYNYILTNYC